MHLEAAVERFFSQLKCNIGDRRERMTPTAAVSQVLFNSSLDFIENVNKPQQQRSRDVVSDDEDIVPATQIPLTTWQWIFDRGCAGHWAKVAEAHDCVDELRAFFEPHAARVPPPARAPALRRPREEAVAPAGAPPPPPPQAEVPPPAAAPVRLSAFGRVIQNPERFQFT
jgi:hypothetical protein